MTATHESADFVVVGSGAGGATVALMLAEAGRDIIILEEGQRVREEDRALGTTEALLRLFRDAGTQFALGRSVIPVLQGRCVGGTTVVNSAIVWRLPEDAYARCFAAIGAAAAVPYGELERCFTRIEADLGIATTPDDLLGGNGRLMRQAAGQLGLRGHVIQRNVSGCRGSARCLEACPTERKQSMERTYLPRAVALGARILAGHEARTVEVRSGRAVAVRARSLGRGGAREVRIEARRGVVLSASAVQSPGILWRSGIGARAHVGAHFRAHPGTAVIGVYPDPVRSWEGGTQTYEVDHFRDQGFKLETISLPLELAGTRMKAIGPAFARTMADYGHMALWGAQVRAEAEGRVRPGGTRSRISYTPTPADMALFRRSVKLLAEMHFAAGARRVFPGVHGGPEVLTGPDQLALLDDLPLDPRAWGLIASHLFGTCRMGKDAQAGVVGFDLAVHGCERLWVADASALATNPGVNPQHTIMALAMLAGERIASA